MQPQFMQSRAVVLVAVLMATILLSACGSKPDADDIRKQLVSGIQCDKFIIRDVKKIDGAEAPDKQYQVAYTFVAEIKGGKLAAAGLFSKWQSLQEQRQSTDELTDCHSLTGNYWLVQLYSETKRNLAEGPGPIPIPYAIEFQGTGFMGKAESGWVFTGNSRIPQVGKTIQSEPLKFDRPKPPPPVAAAVGEFVFDGTMIGSVKVGSLDSCLIVRRDDGSAEVCYRFLSDSQIAKQIFVVCKGGDKCSVSGLFETAKKEIVSVKTVSNEN